jgi:hypothetical protein
MTGEWNECLVRGCGAWWPYKTERVGLGRFGLVGYREGSGWGREVVERVRGVQGECLHREVSEREGLLQGFLKYCIRLAWIFSSPLPNTKGQEGGVLLQYQVDQRKG